MMRQAAIVFVLAAVLAPAAAGETPQVVESWLGSADAREYDNLMVIGISDDQDVRHHFEDKFVSHLRGQGIDAVTSHSLVPDLQRIEDRDAILNQVMEKQIDAAVTVRLIPLDKNEGETWVAGWAASMDEDTNLRLLIEATLPVDPVEAERYGLEIAVWETQHRYRVWAGRTDAMKLKRLREGAGDFVEYTIDALRDAKLLR